MDFLAKKRKAPKKLGKEIWGCDISLHKVTADRMEWKLDATKVSLGWGVGGIKLKKRRAG